MTPFLLSGGVILTLVVILGLISLGLKNSSIIDNFGAQAL